MPRLQFLRQVDVVTLILNMSVKHNRGFIFQQQPLIDRHSETQQYTTPVGRASPMDQDFAYAQLARPIAFSFPRRGGETPPAVRVGGPNPYENAAAVAPFLNRSDLLLLGVRLFFLSVTVLFQLRSDLRINLSQAAEPFFGTIPFQSGHRPLETLK